MSDLSKSPFEVAEALGVDCILPKGNELFIDLDCEADEKWMYEMLKVLHDNGYELTLDKITQSRGGGKHAYLHWDEDEWTPLERVAMQACLGSDRKRELLSFLRIGLGDEKRPPTTFFEARPGHPLEPTGPPLPDEEVPY